tara:strand:- start:1772 stop:2827 length:1056 start_codon:yes stop_codon:yes gene_type:complete
MQGQEEEAQVDWVKEISEGKRQISDAPSEIIDQIANGHFEEQSDLSNESNPIDPSIKNEQTEQVEVESELVQDEAWFKKANYDLSNELNTERQRKASHERKLKEDPLYRESYFKQIGVAVPSTSEMKEETKEYDLDNVDVYDEDFLKSQARETAELKRELSEMKKYRQSQEVSSRMTQEQAEHANKIRHIDELSSTVPELRTDRSFTELNKLVDSGINRPELLKAQGVSDSDIAKMNKIYEIAKSDTMTNTNNFKYALVDANYAPSRGISSESPAQLEQRAIQNKQNEIKNQVDTMSTPRGQQGFNANNKDGMSEAQAEAIINTLANKDPGQYSADERSNLEIAYQALGVS